jgi:hypothetical protein
MNLFTDFQALVTLMGELEYGFIDNLEVEVPLDDPGLRKALRSPQIPLSKFARFITEHSGKFAFLSLKIKDGQPVFGESEYRTNGHIAVQNHKFS